MNIDIENLIQKRWAGVTHAVLIIMSFSLPWAYPEDYGSTASIFGMNLTTGSELQTLGDFTGFVITGGIMIAAAVYLWHRWRNKAAVKTALTLFALVALYPILAAGSIERIWLGYLTTLLLSAPIPTLMFVNWTHQKLEPHGGITAAAKKIYNQINSRLSRTGNAPQP